MFKPEDGRRKTEDGGRLDVAINRAVRELLDVEPPAGLRARVIGQLPASSSRLPASGFRLPVFGFGVAVVATIFVLGVMLPRRAAQPVAPVTVATTQPPSAPSPQVASVTGPETIKVAESPARHTATQPVLKRTILAASFGPAQDAGGMEPLKAIDPIHVASLSQESIAPVEIAVRPLSTIVEMQIALLNPPERRD